MTTTNPVSWWHWHRDGRRWTHVTGEECDQGCGCGATDLHTDDCRMVLGEGQWPEATNYAEAGRLHNAYVTELKADDKGPLYNESDGETWRRLIYNQREREALIALAQVHATLAVADELRATREWGYGLIREGRLP